MSEDEAKAGKLVARLDVEMTASGWTAPGVERRKINGQKHGFDAFPDKSPAAEEVRVVSTDGMYSAVLERLVGVSEKGSNVQ